MSVTLPPFQHLVDTYWLDVARLARSMAGPGEGDDVAQQAWTQALSAYPKLRSSANLRSWLMTITARCAMDGHRSRARRPTPVETVPDEAMGASGADFAVAEADSQLWEQVRSLPARQREAIALRYVADLDHAGVAAAMGTTPAATRRLVSDALAALRDEVSP